MCGIIGFYSLGDKCVSAEKMRSATQAIRHRGPDHQGVSILKSGRCGLGHARLSIIDRTPGANQPMSIGDYVVVFNGEIYNYVEIRDELVANGYVFQTQSDTEVLVQAYDYWGEECVKKFNGMWGFAIFNQRENRIFCSRDRFGVKPFNYSLNEERFIFSSEIKALLVLDGDLAIPNYNSLGLFAREGVGAEIEETWFQGIKRLMPGMCLEITAGRKERLWRYYEYPNRVNYEISFEEAKKTYLDTFIDALKLRMRSDVPIGATLSGGLDSSSIVGGIRTFFSGEIQTYTAGFKNFKDNESAIAEETAKILSLSQNSVECDYTAESYWNDLKKIIFHLESGHFSPSIFPLWKIYEKASKTVTVLLEGQGADEHLCGYIESIAGVFLEDLLRRGKILTAISSLRKLKKNYSLKNIMVLYLRIRMPSFLRTLSRRVFLGTEGGMGEKIHSVRSSDLSHGGSNNFLMSYLQKSHQQTLTSLLHYGDAISMAFSMESRLPYMDYRLVDLAMSLPPEYLIQNGVGKFLQREALKDVIPNQVRLSATKRGFPSPIEHFLAQNRDAIKNILLSPVSVKRGVVSFDRMSKVLNYTGRKWKNAHRFVFRMICIELWFQEFIDKKE